jgi:hypothetical protein
MKKGDYNQQEIANLQTLLLHEENENVLLALELIANKPANLNKELIYMLLMIEKFDLSTHFRNMAAQILKQKKPTAHSLRVGKAALQIFELNRSVQNNYHQKFQLFCESLFFTNGYFLQNQFWERFLYNLFHLFKQYQLSDLSFQLIEHLLGKNPDNYFLGTERFNILSALIDKGQYYEQIPAQINWLQKWVKMHPNFSAMVFCTIAQYHSLLKNYQSAEEFYLKTITDASKNSKDKEHESRACNNLAVIYCKQNQPQNLHNAYTFAIRAVELSPKNHFYLETLAYLEWKYKMNYTDALALYEETIFIEIHNLAAHYHKAALLVELKKPYQAQSHLEYIFTAKLKKQKTYLEYTINGLKLYADLLINVYKEEEKAELVSKKIAELNKITEFSQPS